MSYWRLSRSPRYSLLFALPLLVLYETLGPRWMSPDWFRFGASSLLISVLPRTYHVEAQLLAQRNSLMSALGNPDRTVPPDADAPTRGAVETVKRRDNVISIMKETDLMKEWERTRPPFLRFRDRLLKPVTGRHDETEIRKLIYPAGNRFDTVLRREGIEIAP